MLQQELFQKGDILVFIEDTTLSLKYYGHRLLNLYQNSLKKREGGNSKSKYYEILD